MKIGDSVRVVCPPQEEGTVCRSWGYTGSAKIVATSGRYVALSGCPRSFSRRVDGNYVMEGYSRHKGPRLEVIDVA